MNSKITGLLILTIFSFGLLQCTKSNKSQKQGTLKEQLANKAANSKAPADAKKIMLKAIEDLKAEKVAEKAVKVGGVLPKFNLPDVSRGNFNSKEMNQKGPMIITFYRGGWCPYCNLQLKDLHSRMSEIKEAGGILVAISPEKADRTQKMVEEKGYDFYVLSDVNGIVSRKFGLAYTLPEDLKKVYLNNGLNLEDFNGNDKWELPLAATYVIDANGKIVYSFIDADYKVRAETEEVIKALKSLNTKSI